MQYDPAQKRIITPAHGELGLTHAEWAELCADALDALPLNTSVTVGDIDHILSYGITRYLDAMDIPHD